MRTCEDLDITFSLCVHRDQNIVFGGTVGEMLKFWDFRMKDPCICALHAHNDIVSSVSTSPNG